VGLGGGPYEEFLGVYSGRISEESDLGFVWKSSALREVIGGAVHGTADGPSANSALDFAGSQRALARAAAPGRLAARSCAGCRAVAAGWAGEAGATCSVQEAPS
jgi:hypothetical protein